MLGLGACLALGIVLRVFRVGAQIPLDDEWHGLDFALSRDGWFLFTHFSRAGANSIPFNLYLRALLVTVGWTEWTMALPSILAGIGLVWVFPRWVWRRFGPGPAWVTAALLAMAPFLVYYSRVARAYAVVLLLECLALVALCEWLRTARWRRAAEVVIFGALAIWVHASALPALLTAVAAAAGHTWLRARRAPGSVAPRPLHVAGAGLAMVVLAGALWLPALVTPMPVMALTSAHFSMRTFTGVCALLSGTAWVPLQVVYFAALVGGIVLVFKRAPQELAVLGGATAGCLGAVLVSRPNCGEVAGVFIRYLLPAFLLASLCLGVVVDRLVRAAATAVHRRMRLTLSLGFLAGLLMAGPLPRLYGSTNSFTKHPAFAYDYAKHDSDRARPDPLVPSEAPGLRRSELQTFYADLAREGGKSPIIEYPFILGGDSNLMYFPQQEHGRPVLAGYYRSGALEPDVFGIAVASRKLTDARAPSRGFILNGFTVDHVFGRSERSDGDTRIRFRTVVDIADRAAVSRSGAEYVILHWNLLREFFRIGPVWGKSWFVAQIREQLEARYGDPVFETGVLCVFRVNSPR